ncbi:5-bromo-4-chloroindolyl phosphate hydrolysis family protein [Blautia sp. HCP3S3_G3]|uniref:5-bromo-4-chloroindolyl phosphate hydrolysis family protein n=1 Tax=Blautia sp. HCP3S3_G3 TaxID=3438913 RepID=UPI003F8C2267
MDDWQFNGLDDLEKIGDKVQDIIEKAIDSQNYQKLNQNITQAVNHTIRQYQENLAKNQNSGNGTRRASERRISSGQGQRASERLNRRPAQPEYQVAEPWEAKPELYRSLTGQKLKNILYTVFGGILTGGMTVGFLTVSLFQLAMGSANFGPAAVMFVGVCTGGGLLGCGCSGLARIGRFRKYVKTLGTHTYCNIEDLSRVIQKPVKYVRKDVKKMISSGWFLEGHVDRQETCLITANETYRQYEETQKQLEMRKAKEQERLEARNSRKPEVQEVLDKGNEYLKKIHESNDAIPGEEISAKISKMEQIVQRIFERAEEHPEIIPDLKRLMNYYLPMTVKLLDAYEDMDRQPIQGETITNSKAEIEKTLDTLNEAFARLLDSVFQDTAWDVSSDISVLNTVLAQEGLTGNDFDKLRKEGEKR